MQVLVYAERRTTAILRLVEALRERMGAERRVDEETLRELDDPVDPEHLLEVLRGRLDRDEGAADGQRREGGE